MTTITIILFALVTASSAQAQPPQKSNPAKSQHASQEKPSTATRPLDGIWPTSKLMNALLLRWSHQIANQYDLDTDQRTALQKEILTRWPAFLQENRQKIQPLVNQFLEMRLALEPPSPEDIKNWAKHAQPIIDDISTQIVEGANDVRKLLTPEQRIPFDADRLKLSMGMHLASAKIQAWEEGEYQPHDFWQPLRNTQQKSKQKAAPITPGPTIKNIPVDQIAIELSSWDKYVTNFIKFYALNESQQDAARSILGEMTQRAEAHRNRHRKDIDTLEASIRLNSGNDDEIQSIREKLVTLYGPIDNMFETLRTRLLAIPTKNQHQLSQPQDLPK